MDKSLLIVAPSSIEADLLKYDEVRITGNIVIESDDNYIVTPLKGNVTVEDANNPFTGTKYRKDIAAPDKAVYSLSPFDPMNVCRLDGATSLTTFYGNDLDIFNGTENLKVLQSNIGGDISALRNDNSLIKLSSNKVTGDISALSNCTALQVLYIDRTQVTGDISALSNCTALQNLHIDNTQVTGDISALSNLSELRSIRLPNNVIGDLSKLTQVTWIQTSKALLSWSSPTNRSSKTNKPLTMRANIPLNLASDIDNFLIDNAKCINVDTSAGKESFIYRLVGTRTSASDNAVSTLKGMGFTIIVNGNTL